MLGYIIAKKTGLMALHNGLQTNILFLHICFEPSQNIAECINQKLQQCLRPGIQATQEQNAVHCPFNTLIVNSLIHTLSISEKYSNLKGCCMTKGHGFLPDATP